MKYKYFGLKRSFDDFRPKFYSSQVQREEEFFSGTTGLILHEKLVTSQLKELTVSQSRSRADGFHRVMVS